MRSDGFSLVASIDSDDDLVGDGRGGGLSDARAGDDSRQHLSSDRRTFVNLLISFVGAGVLGIPFAFRQVKRAKHVINSGNMVGFFVD